MNKLILAAFIGVFNFAPSNIVSMPKARPLTPNLISENECKYTLLDAAAGLKGMVRQRFVLRQESMENGVEMGLVFFHDTKSADKESADAIAVVSRLKKNPEKEIVFAILYNKNGVVTSFTRQVSEDDVKNSTLNLCFDKKVENIGKE